MRACSVLALPLLAASVLLGAVATASAQPPAQPRSPSVLFGGTVNAVDRVGDTLILGGDFIGASAPGDAVYGGIALVDPQSGNASAFPVLAGASINTMLSDGAGGFYLAGVFPDGRGIKRLLASGSFDTGFGRVEELFSYAQMALGGSTLYIADRSNLIAVDATTGNRMAFSAAIDTFYEAAIRSLTVSDGVLYVAGLFYNIKSNSMATPQSRNGLAAFEVASGTLLPWNPVMAVDNHGVALVDGDTLYIGSAGGSDRYDPYRLDAVDKYSGAVTATIYVGQWPAAKPFSAVGRVGDWVFVAIDGTLKGFDLTGVPRAWEPQFLGGAPARLTTIGTTLYVGGAFTGVDGEERAGAVAFDFAAAPTLTSWNPAMNGPVWDLQTAGTIVAARGSFTAVHAEVREGLAAIDLPTGALTPWAPRGGRPTTIATTATHVFTGGSYLPFGKYSLATGQKETWQPAGLEDIWLMAAEGSTVFVYGRFDVAGVETAKLAAIDAASGTILWQAVVASTDFAQVMGAIAPVGSDVYIGGFFSAINGAPIRSIAKLDAATGELRSDFASPLGLGDGISRIALRGQTLYAIGYLSAANHAVERRTFAFDGKSGVLLPWTTGLIDFIGQIAADANLIYVAGVHGVFPDTNRIADSFTAAGTAGGWDLAMASSDYVTALSATDPYVVVAGSFTNLAHVFSPNLAIFGPPVVVPPPPPPPIEGPPAAPQNLLATISNNVVTLDWTSPSSGTPATSYTLEAGFTSGAVDIVLPLGAATSLSLSAPNGTFYVRVRGVNGHGTGPASSEVTLQVPSCTLPKAPTNLAASLSGGVLSLSWQSPANVTNFLGAGSGPGLVDIAVLNLGSTTSIAAAVPPGTYFIKVGAMTSCGGLAISNEIAVVVSAPDAPGVPTGLSAVVMGNTVALSWAAPETGTVTSYVLEAGTGPDAPTNVVVAEVGAVTQLVVPNVPAGQYQVRVRARGPGGPGLATDQVLVTVPQ